MGSILSGVIFLQAFYAMEEGHACRNLDVHPCGLGKYLYKEVKVFRNTNLCFTHGEAGCGEDVRCWHRTCWVAWCGVTSI